MTLAQYTSRSVNNLRILVQLDINKINIQWVNYGAGIWGVNFDNIYSFIDTTLLDGFTTQYFGDIGSVSRDGYIHLVKITSLSLLTSIPNSFYWDITTNALYIRFSDYDDPYLHNIYLGVTYGYSFNEFTPIDSPITYEGRLKSIPSLGKSRDPLFFGKLSYDGGAFSFINSDGYFDAFADTKDIYGNECRILFGYEELSVDDYQTVYSGIMETVTLDGETFSVSTVDKRKTLTKKVFYVTTDTNALTAIEELIYKAYNIPYSDFYYDTAQWEAMRSHVPNVTLVYEDDNEGNPTEDVIDAIEDVCNACFGVFDVNIDGRYTFKIIDSSLETAPVSIPYYDIFETPSIEYNPAEVISSVKIAYQNNTDFYYLDKSQEDAIVRKYKIYNEKDVTTCLFSLAAAQAYATKLLNYANSVHGITTITVPLKYYNLKIGNLVNAELSCNINRPMLGIKECEVIGISPMFDKGQIELKLRIL